MKAVVVALFAVLAVAAAIPASPKDDLKASEAVYMASPYMASPYMAAVNTYAAAVPAYSAYSYSAPAMSAYTAYSSPYAYSYMFR